LASTFIHRTEQLIGLARAGDSLSLGPLLDSYSPHLRRLADGQLDDKLRSRLSSSDIVQETLLQATRDFGSFRGNSDAEFGSWLRRILSRRIAKSVEVHLLTEKRDVRREIVLQRITSGHGSHPVSDANRYTVADQHPGPASEAVCIERGQQLAKAMASLPASYREIIEMRNAQGLPFDVIAQRTNGTSGAARMRWLRAIDMLRQQLNERN